MIQGLLRPAWKTVTLRMFNYKSMKFRAPKTSFVTHFYNALAIQVYNTSVTPRMFTYKSMKFRAPETSVITHFYNALAIQVYDTSFTERKCNPLSMSTLQRCCSQQIGMNYSHKIKHRWFAWGIVVIFSALLLSRVDWMEQECLNTEHSHKLFYHQQSNASASSQKYYCSDTDISTTFCCARTFARK